MNSPLLPVGQGGAPAGPGAAVPFDPATFFAWLRGMPVESQSELASIFRSFLGGGQR